jgi:hypothetical protein
MKLFTAVWSAGFVGWDMAWAVDAAQAGDWSTAWLFVGLAAVTAALGIVGYLQKPGWLRR